MVRLTEKKLDELLRIPIVIFFTLFSDFSNRYKSCRSRFCYCLCKMSTKKIKMIY